MADSSRILLIEDDETIATAVQDFLGAHGIACHRAMTCAQADEAVLRIAPDAVVLDYMLPDGDALSLLPRIRAALPDLPVIVLTGHASIELAVNAIKLGADQFLTKPVALPALLIVIRRAIDTYRERRKTWLQRTRHARTALSPFLGGSEPIQELAHMAARVRDSRSPILIQGETGSGKGVLARWLHDTSERANEPFVDLNCAGLSREFLEAELFGHEKGAFTGAVAHKPGLMEVAKGGTLFLDEIGDMPLEVQPKLLKVIEEKRYRRMGDVRERETSFRLITATHHDLNARVASGQFREDLLYRINALPLRLPTLRERRVDIAAHARRMLDALCMELGRAPAQLSADAQAALENHAWPGNLRELRNVLERTLILSDRGILHAADIRLPHCVSVHSGSHSPQAHVTLVAMEKQHIEHVLHSERGHVERAAIRLGIPRSTLYQKIKLHGIVVKDKQHK